MPGRLDVSMKLVALFVTLIAVLSALAAPQAQETLRIAAVVNDEVISLLDVNARIRLSLVTINQAETPDAFRQMFPQVLRGLIDERLQLQEAKTKGIDISQSDIDAVVAEIEQNNRMPAGGLYTFLESRRVQKDTLISQVRARIAWQRTVARRLRLTYHVTGDQIDEALEQFKENLGKPEYLLAEIYLSVDNPDNDAEVKRTADQMVAEIKRGADFPSIARQFSESASAGSGGDLGWVQATQLEPEINGIIGRMQIGETSEPIRAVTGYHIVWLREKRTNAVAQAGELRVSLRRLLVPVTPDAPDLAAKTEQAKKTAAAIKSCDDLPRAATELGAPPPTDLGTLRLTDLAPQLQPLVATLEVGRASAPLSVEAGLVIMAVCSRTDPAAAQLPSRDQMTQRLLSEKLDGESRKYLRDLRQAAYIDIRA
jgi:peptidyl-prolyl cis-trans isomerase SurA